ncbi:MAG: hypothetical protein Q9207_001837 [Kuettlingeria erythrocarpa]
MPTLTKFTSGEPKYTHIEETHLMSEAGSESDLALPRKKSRAARFGTALPWALSTALLVLLGASWALKWSNECGISTYERGFETELGPAKPHIRMQKVRYRGTPIFGDDGEEFVDYLPGETKYVGEPSDEIDEAWNELTKSELLHSSLELPQWALTRSNIGRFFLLSEAEAKAQFGPSYTHYWNDGWNGYAAR